MPLCVQAQTVEIFHQIGRTVFLVDAMPSFLYQDFYLLYLLVVLYLETNYLVIYILKSTEPFKFSGLIVLKFKIKLDMKDFNAFYGLRITAPQEKLPAAL